MRRRTRLGMLGALLLALAIPVAAVNAAGGGLAPFEQRIKPHDLPHPLGSEQRALHAKAMEMKVEGKFAANAKVGKVGKGPKGQWVQLAREGEESILTMLGTFDDLANNEIPEPDRTKDNSTIWDENFDRAHYLDLLFSETPGDVSMRNFYVELSSNRYTVNGDVTDWATAPQPGLYYNDDINQPGVCGAGEGNGTWAFLRDVGQQWWNGQIAAGKTAGAAQRVPGGRSTSGTATTPTATRTSTRPTATSTTSSPCMPAWARRSAVVSSAQARSGATAGTPASA